jgi:type IV pilus assembly protein PilW
VLAAGQLLGWPTTAYAAQTENAAIDDAGRYALELVGRAVRQGACRSTPADLAAPVDVLAGAAGGAGRPLARQDHAGIDAPLATAAAVANGSDVLAVRFPGAGAAPEWRRQRRRLRRLCRRRGRGRLEHLLCGEERGGEAELRCKYRGAANWSADAVVSGVDSFQVLYGLDTDTPRDGVANRYVNADAIVALDAALAGLAPPERNRQTHWKRVVSVRIGLLLHGSRPSRHDAANREFQLFGATHAANAADADPGTVLREATCRTRCGGASAGCSR